MTIALTRSEMYQLVWAEPRTTLAKRFKISDVAIAKHCRAANIPMPPPGHWARQLSGKPAARPALPLRLPGQRDRVFSDDEDRYGYDSRKEYLDDMPTPPSFSEPIELLVADAVKRIGKVQACRDLTNPHPGMKRLLESERRRRENSKTQPFSDYYKPHFDDQVFQRQLRLINSLLWGFDRIGCKGEAFAMREWFQGVGELHFLRASISIGTTGVSFEFMEPSTPKAAKKVPPMGTTTLRVASHSCGTIDWHDQAKLRLEKQLTAIAAAMLELAENGLRRDAMRTYERCLERRQKMVEAIAAKRIDDERRRVEAIENHRQCNHAKLRALAAEHQAASELRRFVDAVRDHPERAESNVREFSEWQRKVLAFADSIDPVVQPLSRILSSITELPEDRKND